MRTELVNAFGNTFLTITQDHENRWIRADWQGYSTEEAIKTGMTAYTQALEQSHLHAMLIDTRQMAGSWSHSLDWMLEEWAPQAARAGLQYYALLVEPESFAEASADAFYEQVRYFKAKVFEDLESAENWLQRRSNWLQSRSYQLT
ncbi:STAS/SEC14 domain-containing protein [Nibribacter ruber]|uniref:STAS/SEC14 domain-containing protein n=1 Tax=Nibribacter ruber TaxID=2698458 RepID=A0A6P1P0K8_9BACT|nr:STAS/SEC14 domain-containing protein [Nibribacter ruber]QHL88219.1 STAS/SEC14 domain-containing protein [Nibribacter ruber]